MNRKEVRNMGLDATVSCRVTSEARWWLELLAEVEQSSVSDVMRRMIERSAVQEIKKMRQHRGSDDVASQRSFWNN